MSCFVMKKETLAALANAVESLLNSGYNYWGFEAPYSLVRALNDCWVSGIYLEYYIYLRLYTVNICAYNGRYVNREEQVDEGVPDIDMSKYILHRPPKYREHGFAVCPWHYHFAKILDCWLYQTSEDATRKDPLRRAMVELRDVLFRFIVQNSPQYVDVQWGEPPRSEKEEADIGS